MNKIQLISILEEIGTLLDLKGENPFKSRAYYNAARNLESHESDPATLVETGELGKIKGVGKALVEKITELVKTGRLEYYENLKNEFPETLFEMLKIPGFGPKKVKSVYDKLDVKSVGELEYACKENRLVSLDGFGEKSQAKVLKGIEMLKKYQGRYHLSVAQIEGQALLEKMASLPEVKRSSLCGSLRRGQETIKDVDILVSTEKPAAVMEAFVQEKQVEEITGHGETKSSVVLKGGLNADLRAVTDEEFPYAQQYFTGSKEHNTAVRALAKKQGLKLNEYGLYKEDENILCKDEAEIYKTLGLEYIEPALRENTGEIEAAENGGLPNLVTQEDLQGIFHVHSTWSDGADSIEVMAKAALALGFKYLGMADHSKSAFYANGLSEDRVKAQHEEIDRLNETLEGISLLKGIESDILVNGDLDYEDSVLESFDFVVASVHSLFNLSEKDQTERICRAVSNPYTTILGHPTGRLVLTREGYPVDINQVLETAAEHKKIVELNAHPYRLDLNWRHCKIAKQLGIPISINPDSHQTAGLTDVQYGIATARRGWLSKEDVFNTRSLNEIKIHLQKK